MSLIDQVGAVQLLLRLGCGIGVLILIPILSVRLWRFGVIKILLVC